VATRGSPRISTRQQGAQADECRHAASECEAGTASSGRETQCAHVSIHTSVAFHILCLPRARVSKTALDKSCELLKDRVEIQTNRLRRFSQSGSRIAGWTRTAGKSHGLPAKRGAPWMDGSSLRSHGTAWDARTYDRSSQPQQAWAGEVLARLGGVAPDAAVLDVGCGTGRVTETLLALVPRGRVLAIDASADMVALARERLGDRAEVWCEDVLDLELHEPVDAIISTATLHWVPDHDRLWARLAGVLRPGGVLEIQCGGEATSMVSARSSRRPPAKSHRSCSASRPGLRGTARHGAALAGDRLHRDPLLATGAPHIPRGCRGVCAHVDPRGAPRALGARAPGAVCRRGPRGGAPALGLRAPECLGGPCRRMTGVSAVHRQIASAEAASERRDI